MRNPIIIWGWIYNYVPKRYVKQGIGEGAFTEGKFIALDWGDEVDYSRGFSPPASQAGRHVRPAPIAFSLTGVVNSVSKT
jgi:hypothetical protein